MTDDRLSYFDLRKYQEIPAKANEAVINILSKKYEKILKDPEQIRKDDTEIRKEKQHGKYIISNKGVPVAVMEYTDGIIQRYWILAHTSENTVMNRSVLNEKVSFKQQKKSNQSQ